MRRSSAGACASRRAWTTGGEPAARCARRCRRAAPAPAFGGLAADLSRFASTVTCSILLTRRLLAEEARAALARRVLQCRLLRSRLLRRFQVGCQSLGELVDGRGDRLVALLG